MHGLNAAERLLPIRSRAVRSVRINRICRSLLAIVTGDNPDYVDVFRRCRNAVYHSQDNVLDKRILEAIRGEEQYKWLVAMKWEFERYLYLFPFYKYGYNSGSLELSSTYLGTIGWKPSENVYVIWIDAFYMCQNYYLSNEFNKLENNNENDQMIAGAWKYLQTVKNPNFLLSRLSRFSDQPQVADQ